MIDVARFMGAVIIGTLSGMFDQDIIVGILFCVLWLLLLTAIEKAGKR